MNPEQARKLDEIYKWMQQKKRQQISFPVDLPSINALGAVTKKGNGTKSLTATISFGPGGGSANVPAAYSGTLVISAGGATYEIPFL